MKKLLKIVGVLAVLLLALFGGLFALLFMGNAKIIDGQELGPARVIKDGMVSAFMVDSGPGHVLLVDCGNDPDAKAILAELARRGLGPDAVSAIFLTHGHPDHMAGCPHFPNAPVYALAEDVDLAEGRVGGKGPLTHLFGLNKHPLHISHALVGGDTTTVGTRAVHTYALPGHTAGSAAYLIDGVLFLGDSASINSSGELDGGKWLVSDDAAQNHQQLAILAKQLTASGVEVKWLAPAHSGPAAGLGPLQRFSTK